MYYKGTQQECIDYDVLVTSSENYQYNDNWANPIKIEGSCYILKHEKYSTDLELVKELPETNQDIE
jgi:hypothetical protein